MVVTARRLLLAALTLLSCAGLPELAAGAQETATLRAGFTPDRLGAPTTISFGFHLRTSDGLAPPPLKSVDLHMPAAIDYTDTTLGLAICKPAALVEKGLTGCPPNSRLGFGTAFVEVPFGIEAGHEFPEIQALMGPPHDGNEVVLLYANGETPVSAQLVFQGEVLPDTGRFGSQLTLQVPPISSVPAGPDVSIVDVRSTIGPRGLTYYHRSHGRLIPFHPKGVSIPERCPRNGFPFLAEFVFQDGTHTSAGTSVPCPARRSRRTG
jgi:hypothetical protein